MANTDTVLTEIKVEFTTFVRSGEDVSVACAASGTAIGTPRKIVDLWKKEREVSSKRSWVSSGRTFLTSWYMRYDSQTIRQ